MVCCYLRCKTTFYQDYLPTVVTYCSFLMYQIIYIISSNFAWNRIINFFFPSLFADVYLQGIVFEWRSRNIFCHFTVWQKITYCRSLEYFSFASLLTSTKIPTPCSVGFSAYRRLTQIFAYVNSCVITTILYPAGFCRATDVEGFCHAHLGKNHNQD